MHSKAKLLGKISEESAWKKAEEILFFDAQISWIF